MDQHNFLLKNGDVLIEPLKIKTDKIVHNLDIVNKEYVDEQILESVLNDINDDSTNKYVKRDGDIMTGVLVFDGNVAANGILVRGFGGWAYNNVQNTLLEVQAGGKYLNPYVLVGVEPTDTNHATTKKYVDDLDTKLWQDQERQDQELQAEIDARVERDALHDAEIDTLEYKLDALLGLTFRGTYEFKHEADCDAVYEACIVDCIANDPNDVACRALCGDNLINCEKDKVRPGFFEAVDPDDQFDHLEQIVISKNDANGVEVDWAGVLDPGDYLEVDHVFGGSLDKTNYGLYRIEEEPEASTNSYGEEVYIMKLQFLQGDGVMNEGENYEIRGITAAEGVNPEELGDFLTKDQAAATYLPLTGGTLTGTLNMSGNAAIKTRHLDSGENSNLEIKHNGVSKVYVGGDQTSFQHHIKFAQTGKQVYAGTDKKGLAFYENGVQYVGNYTADNHVATKKNVDKAIYHDPANTATNKYLDRAGDKMQGNITFDAENVGIRFPKLRNSNSAFDFYREEGERPVLLRLYHEGGQVTGGYDIKMYGNTHYNQLRLMGGNNANQTAFTMRADCSVSFHKNLSLENNKITKLSAPTDNTDAANKKYVDQQIEELLAKIEELEMSGGTTKNYQFTVYNHNATSNDIIGNQVTPIMIMSCSSDSNNWTGTGTQALDSKSRSFIICLEDGYQLNSGRMCVAGRNNSDTYDTKDKITAFVISDVEVCPPLFASGKNIYRAKMIPDALMNDISNYFPSWSDREYLYITFADGAITEVS